MEEDEHIVPRGPFKGKRIVMASTSGVDMYQSIAEDFMKRIFDFDAGDFLISDESNLSDLVGFEDRDTDALYRKICEEYEIDRSEIESGNLLQIFRKIHRRMCGGAS